MEIERDGRRVSITVTPEPVTAVDRFGTEHTFGRLGIRSNQVGIERLKPLSAVAVAGSETWSIVGQTLDARSEARRVGQERDGTSSSGWSRSHTKKKITITTIQRKT